MHINLGCGDKKLDGYLNVDIREDTNPDICMDISDLSRFKNCTFDYMLAHDILEHFSHLKVWDVLEEWIRCLKIGGQLEIQVPSIDRIYADRKNLINRYKGDSALRFSRLIFGGQDYPANFHCVCFTYEFFQCMEQRLNLKIVKYFPEICLYNHKVILEKVR